MGNGESVVVTSENGNDRFNIYKPSKSEHNDIVLQLNKSSDIMNVIKNLREHGWHVHAVSYTRGTSSPIRLWVNQQNVRPSYVTERKQLTFVQNSQKTIPTDILLKVHPELSVVHGANAMTRGSHFVYYNKNYIDMLDYCHDFNRANDDFSVVTTSAPHIIGQKKIWLVRRDKLSRT